MKKDSGCSRKNIRYRLQTKLLVNIILLETVLITAIILVFEHQLQKPILEEFFQQGLSVTRDLAAANADFITAHNYKKIEHSLEQVVEEKELLYATVLLYDGEVAGYRGHEDFKQEIFAGPLHERALGSEDALVQHSKLAGEQFYDIAVPIFVKGERLSTVRAGFPPTKIQTTIASIHEVLLFLGGIGLVCGWLTSIFLARRITRPIGDLVESVTAISNGEYHQPITISTQDEIGYLGRRFAGMQATLKEQFQLLSNANQQLVVSNECLQREIAERRNKEERIRYLAFHDALTGLANRALLKELLIHTLHQARRYQQSVAVLFLDLDHFKIINDTLGHNAGDELLQIVASRLNDCIRESDCIARGESSSTDNRPAWKDENTVARLGGDEFVILLTGIRCEDNFAIIARRINRVLAEPIVLQGKEVHVSTSIGISQYPMDGDDAETLLKRADAAMYQAKVQGRNSYQFYTASFNARVQERLSMENDLRRALEETHFVLYYQARADAQAGHIVGMESLARWLHPDRGFISPDEFIPIAEEMGLIIPLGKWVLRTACAQARAWQVAGLPPLRISVNLSAAQFKQKDLVDMVAGALQETGLEPKYLELELTESLLMESRNSCSVQLEQLKAIGVNLSIDDFGTGYSSLGYLKHLPIDALKIDRSFIRGIPTDAHNVAIVKATIALAQSLHLEVIAEGVEHKDQLEFLSNHNCDEVQGYLLNRPLPADAFFKYLQNRAPDRTIYTTLGDKPKRLSKQGNLLVKPALSC